MKTERILSEEELEALLGEADGAVAPANVDDSPYDFSSTETTARLALPLVDRVFDSVATSMRTGLLESLRFELGLERDGTRIASAEELLAGLSDPCMVSLFDLAPFPGTALLSLEASVVHALVDGFFGGNGNSSPTRPRGSFSDIERRMGRRVRDVAFAAISESLVDFAPIECRLVREEHNPLLVGSRNLRGPMVLLELLVAVAERSGVIRLAIPLATLEPLRACAAASLRAPERAATATDGRWRSAIDEADIDLRCDIARVGLSVRELVGLSLGDVIPVDIPDRVTLDVSGIPLLEGRFGIRNGRRALRVARLLNPDDLRTSPSNSQSEEESDERIGIR